MTGTITISKDEYLSLKVDSERLIRLENGGVDNWDNYEDALNENEDEEGESMENFEINLRKEIETL